MTQHIRPSRGDKVLSAAVRAGDWLYVSGQASTDPSTGEFIAGTFEEEFHRSVENLLGVITEAGGSMEQIVKVASYVREESALPLYNELYRGAFPHPRPARMTSAMGFGFLQFEIEAVVYLGSDIEQRSSDTAKSRAQTNVVDNPNTQP